MGWFNGGYRKDNFCIDPVGTDGTKYGYVKGSFGTIDPAFTVDGIEMTESSWDAAGNFIISFGSTQLTDVSSIHIKTNNYENVALWDGTNYVFTDVDAATELITLGLTKGCMSLLILPDLFIHYTYSEILRGT